MFLLATVADGVASLFFFGTSSDMKRQPPFGSSICFEKPTCSLFRDPHPISFGRVL